MQNNSKIILSSTNYPYYFNILELKNNSNSQFDVQPNPAGGVVTLYVNSIVGDKFNGNQTINSGRPFNFRMFYLGSNTLTLDGNASMNAGLVAPNASLSESGTFDFNGAILAKRLLLNGAGNIHYDESLAGNGEVNDTQYRLRELIQFYR
ncbi:MAG: hypothetical protein IT292_06800 [Deltaproteobacteria bacterium]|nr:hypothetical protein [Deltaproteobacteria bacterium]